MSNTAFNSNYVSISGGSNPATQQFRLTLASNTPVMTTGVTAATTLYLTPYLGNNIGLYSSGAWSVVSSAEVNLSLAALSSADTLYDIFAYLSGGNVLLEALAWSNSGAGTSARATALTYQDGILVKSGDATRRYIGTIRTVLAGQTEFSFGGTSLDGTEAKLFVDNYYNKVRVKAFSGSSRAIWTYVASGQGSFRAAIGSNTMRVSFVQGVIESCVVADYVVSAQTTNTNTTAMCALGLNTVNASAGTLFCGSSTNSTLPVGVNAKCNAFPSVGFNYLSALDGGNQATTFTFQNKDTNWGNEGAGLTFNGLF